MSRKEGKKELSVVCIEVMVYGTRGNEKYMSVTFCFASPSHETFSYCVFNFDCDISNVSFTAFLTISAVH